MSLPSFVDLQKSCKDLFAKGYHFDKLKVSTKGKTCNGLELNTNATHSLEEKTVLADVQAKLNLGSYGLTTAAKWNTDNMLTKEISCQNYLAQGLTVGVEARLNLESGGKGGMLMGQYKIENATLDVSLEGGDEANLLVNASTVAGYRNFVGGYQIGYDTNDGSLKKNNLAAGYIGNGFSALLNYDNMETVSGSFYQQVSSNLETGIQGSVKGEDGPSFAIAGKYTMNPSGVIVRGKVDNKSQLGIGCELKVNEGTSLFLSGNIDLKDFSAGGQKVGLAIEFA